MEGKSAKENWVDEYWPEDRGASVGELLQKPPDLPFDYCVARSHHYHHDMEVEEDEESKVYKPRECADRVKTVLYPKLKPAKISRIPASEMKSTEELLAYFKIPKDTETQLRELASEGGLEWNVYLNQLYREFNPV